MIFTYFTIQLCSKNFNHFTNLNALNIIKNILLQHSQNHVSGWRQKKHLHCTISRRQKTAFSEHVKSKFVHSWKIRPKIFFFFDVTKLLFGGELNNFLHADRCLGLVKCFKNFHFLLKFLEIQLFFSISILPSVTLKR